MKNNKKSLILAIVLLLVVVIAGVSFAYFSAIITGSESSSTIYMDAGELSITYSDNSNALDVSATKIYPRDEEWITKKFKVTGNNTTELAMYYKVKLVIDNNEFEDSLTYSLDSVNTSDNGKVIASITDGTISGTTTEELGQGYFIAGEDKEHNYTLKIYFKDNNEDQNKYQKAKFAAHIEIEGAGTEAYNSAPSGWSEAASETLLAGIKANYNNPTEPLTTPGTEVSLSTEAVMAAAEDDYGISYYFRGNVQNNFVSFAGMCWRIVRVTGDGSIKLVLYNYSSTDCTQTGNNLAFARYSGASYTTAFNTNYNSNAYVGFMYGSPTGSDYGSTHANETKSTILTNLETWYENNIATYESKLADTIWCNDKSTTGDGKGSSTSRSDYGANNRYTSGTPSLICPNDNEGGKLSKFTVSDTTNGNGNLDYKIGLLTYDELAYAGYKDWETVSTSNYLNGNVSSTTYWWTLSPYYFYNDNRALMWRANGDGKVGGTSVQISDYGLRPSLSLKSTTTINSGGTGTAAAPFVVN